MHRLNKEDPSDIDHEIESSIHASSLYSDICSSETVSEGLTYKRLSDRVFFWSAAILQAVILILALTISNVEVVFQFIGAIGTSSIMYLFPSLAYFKAKCMLRKSVQQKELYQGSLWHTALASLFFLAWLSIIVSFIWL